jgi:hypothetical protein
MIFFNKVKHLLNRTSIEKQFRQSKHSSAKTSAKTSTHFLGLNTFNSIILKMKINFF